MPRPVNGKPAIKGTRGADTIEVTDAGVLVNGDLKPFLPTTIDGGFVISGNSGDDVIIGGRGPDELQGGDGNDRLTGGGGLDRLVGGAGNDTLVDLDALQVDSNLADMIDPNANLGAIFDGGRGIDTMDFSGSSVGVGISLMGEIYLDFSHTVVDGRYSLVLGSQRISDRVSGVENLTGSGFADLLWGNGAENEIHGGSGDDYLNGGGALANNDRLFGDAGNDVLYGLHGDDELTGGTGSDIFMFGSAGSDITGHDIVHDYTPGADILVFEYTPVMPTWTSTTYNGVASLLGTYDDGTSSVLLVGITAETLITMYQTTDINW